MRLKQNSRQKAGRTSRLAGMFQSSLSAPLMNVRLWRRSTPDWVGAGGDSARRSLKNSFTMFDTTTMRLIWRGSASDVLASKPEKNVKELEKDVHKMFEHFPPAF